MAYKISNPKKEKDYENKIIKKLKPAYSFSSDNTIEKTTIEPKEFLRKTYKEGEIRYSNEGEKSPFIDYDDYEKHILFRTRVEGIKEVLLGKKKSKYRIPIPFLEVNAEGNPVGHEGRHTAKALEELGVKKMPVTIVHKDI